jgi:hypothetical protein
MTNETFPRIPAGTYTPPELVYDHFKNAVDARDAVQRIERSYRFLGPFRKFWLDLVTKGQYSYFRENAASAVPLAQQLGEMYLNDYSEDLRQQAATEARVDGHIINL